MVQAALDSFVDWFDGKRFTENSVLLCFAVATGILSALGVAAFYASIYVAYAAFYRVPRAYVPPGIVLAYRPIVTAAGLALAWWVMRPIGRGHHGINVPDVQLVDGSSSSACLSRWFGQEYVSARLPAH